MSTQETRIDESRSSRDKLKDREDEFLLPFELKRLQGTFREYLRIKRNNYLATIEKFPVLWRCFELLDEIWMREFTDLEKIVEVKKMLPGILFMNAHSRFLVALELAFSCCTSDAANILRSGIESVAHACKILREPEQAAVWLDKDEGPAQSKAFKKAFEQKKREVLFPPEQRLDTLYHYWSHYSEIATHSTVSSIGLRFREEQTASHISWRLNYFETDEANLASFLFSFLVASLHMEDVLYRSFESRLKLDIGLGKMRIQLGSLFGKTRQQIIKKYGNELLNRVQPTPQF